MGYNSVVLVLNDALDTIQNNAQQFVDNMCSSIATVDYKPEYRETIYCGNHCNPAEVLCCDHADAIQVVVVHGNTGENIFTTYYIPGMFRGDEWKVELVKQMANELGYNLAKKPSRAKSS